MVEDMKEKILQWLATGEVGLSSETMAFASIGLKSRGAYPLDPADLNRCLLLLRDVPEIRGFFDRIAAISNTWNRFIQRWELLENTFLEEAGLDWSKSMLAPRTYALMNEVHNHKEGIVIIVDHPENRE